MALQDYKAFNLDSFLTHLRQPGRYADSTGINLLTTSVEIGPTWEVEVHKTLQRAELADRRAHALRALEGIAKSADTYMDHEATSRYRGAMKSVMEIPAFQSAFTDPGYGLSRGLNPYTDWTLANIKHNPNGWVIILGVDWYPIGALYEGSDWIEYLNDPFSDKDRFWHTVWGWMLDHRKGACWGGVTPAHAVRFMAETGIGVIFHNPIPYLRPPGIERSDEKWRKSELTSGSLRRQIVEDLQALRLTLKQPCVAVCTGDETFRLLRESGMDAQRIHVWGAHPSQSFYPGGKRPITLSMAADVLPSLAAPQTC